jgi:hypothetical protein
VCTLSFIPRKNGYVLGMNRDEKTDRIEALPPKSFWQGERFVIGPSEPKGGTWITINNKGTTFALINWYSAASTDAGKRISRGLVVRTVCGSNSGELVTSVLKQLTLRRINPFRLIGIFPAKKKIIEWRWNRKRLVQKGHNWRAQQWASSGFDELTAQKFRRRLFEKALLQKSSGSMAWLRQLHRSHLPSRGPFSICMHREDAETVSYTEIIVSGGLATMRYHSGIPCLNLPFQTFSLKLR